MPNHLFELVVVGACFLGAAVSVANIVWALVRIGLEGW